MATTFTLIASSTVGAGGASSIDFTSIPSTYTDLVLKLSTRGTVNNKEIWLTINGSTANGSARELVGNGATAASYTSTRVEGMYFTNNDTANTFTNVEFYCPNYAGSTNKSFSADGVNENNATTGYTELHASLWAQTAAITSISVVLAGGSFVQYSTAYLYGVKNA